MKNRFLFLSLMSFLLCLFSGPAFSQDIIIKLTGEEIEAKVLEVNPTEVKYKKFNNQDGPLFIIKKSEIFMIKYASGEKEVFNQKASTKTDTTGGGNSTTVKVTYSSLGKKKDSPEFWAAIKLNPLLYLVGEFPIYFELASNNKSSFELGLGVTYPNALNSLSLNSYYYNLDEREKKMGYSFTLNYRYYPSLVFDELYFGAEFRYRAYLTELKSCGTQVYQNMTESLAHTDVKLLIGYVTDLGSNAIIDYFIGFGMRNMVYDYYDCNESVTPAILINNTEKSLVPALSLGIKIGFGLNKTVPDKK